MTRSDYLNSLGATRRNTRWSWSAVNHAKRFVIFGAWEEYADNRGNMIFDEEWAVNIRTGRRHPAYPESREHLRLVEEEGYQLKTFPMWMRNKAAHFRNEEPARIDRFGTRAADRRLVKHGSKWFAE